MWLELHCIFSLTQRDRKGTLDNQAVLQAAREINPQRSFVRTCVVPGKQHDSENHSIWSVDTLTCLCLFYKTARFYCCDTIDFI